MAQCQAYGGEVPKFGPEYLIPRPFDPRLISSLAPAVAKAAMDSGVATRPIADFDASYAAYNAFQSQIERYWSLRWLQQNAVGDLAATVLKDGLVRADTADKHGIDDPHGHPAELRQHQRSGQRKHGAQFGFASSHALPRIIFLCRRWRKSGSARRPPWSR